MVNAPPTSGQSASTKAERTRDREVTNDLADELDLLQHTVDQLRAVAATDQNLLDARTQDAAFDLQLWPALVALRVDDPDPACCDDDVVDVGPRAGDASVVQDRDRLRGEGIEPGTQALLADRSGGPRFRALLLVGQSDGDAAELAPLLTQTLLVLGLAPLVLAASRRSGHAAVGF